MQESKRPVFVFTARPKEKAKLPGLFGDGPIQRLLEEPGGLRHAGWDLRTNGQAQIVKGEYLEASLGDKTVRLYEDGMLFARVPGDEDYLGWAATDSPTTPFASKPRLNPLSLLEFTFNFVDFYLRISEHLVPAAKTYTLHVSIRNAKVGEKMLYMNPYGLNTIERLSNRNQYPAPGDAGDISTDVDAHTLQGQPSRAAYLLVERIYLWFGVPPSKIPYTVGETENKVLDVDVMRRGGKEKGEP